MKKVNWKLLASLLLAFAMTACIDLGVDEDDLDDDWDLGGGEGTTVVGDSCNGTIDCTPGSICWNNICVQEGALRVSLVWHDETDLDLHVTTPAGNEIYYGSRTADGGELDVDDCVSSCRVPGGAHVENVFFNDTASAGSYTYWVVNYDCEVAAPYTLEVYEGGSLVDSRSGTLEAACGDSGEFVHVF